MDVMKRIPLIFLCLPMGAVAQTQYRFYPDEFLSQHLLDTSADVVDPSISDDGSSVVYAGEHPQGSFGSAGIYLYDRNASSAQLIAQNCNLAPLCFATGPRISGNGQYVVFNSSAEYDVHDGGNPVSDIFIWQRTNGAVVQVSRGVGGVEANGHSGLADVSRDGRYVVFQSRARNLTINPDLSAAPNLDRVYWKDLQSGEMRVVHAGDSNEGFVLPRISGNGRYVLFRGLSGPSGLLRRWDSVSGQVVPTGFDSGFDIHTGALSSDGRVAAGVAGNQPRTYSWNGATSYNTIISNTFAADFVGSLSVSSGGGFLAWHFFDVNSIPRDTNLVSVQSRTGAIAYIYLGRGVQETTQFGLDMTPDGRYIAVSAFDLLPHSADAGLPSPLNQDHDFKNDVFLIENPLWRQAPTNLTAQFTAIPASSRNVKVSTNGSIGVFESEIPASEFGPYVDSNGTSDIFRYLADFQEIELISTDNGTNAFPGGARNPAMSADGGAVVFEALDSGIAAQNLGSDGKLSAPVRYKASSNIAVFLRRLVQGNVQRISTSRSGGQANGSSTNPAISADGRRVAFGTDASDINPGADPNAVRDVVAVNIETGVRSCVSTCGALVADGPSDRPSISNNGKVAFESGSSAVQKAAGLLKASTALQIVLRDLVNNTSQIVSSSGGLAGNSDSTRASISSSGTVVAYQSGASNLDASGNDGRVNVFRYTPGSGNQRVSRRGPPPGGKATVLADGDSLQPAVSGDGRFVSFQTAATNLADVDANGVVDLVVHDGRKGVLRRLAEGFGGAESNGASETPHLNHNGTVVGFHSFASNLDAESVSETASVTSAPYERDNPLAEGIVFADAFE